MGTQTNQKGTNEHAKHKLTLNMQKTHTRPNRAVWTGTGSCAHGKLPMYSLNARGHFNCSPLLFSWPAPRNRCCQTEREGGVLFCDLVVLHPKSQPHQSASSCTPNLVIIDPILLELLQRHAYRQTLITVKQLPSLSDLFLTRDYSMLGSVTIGPPKNQKAGERFFRGWMPFL